MDDKKFEQMMEDWVSKEMASAPDMRPTPDMRQAVASRKRPFAFALFARWATVGVAAAAMILMAVSVLLSIVISKIQTLGAKHSESRTACEQ